MTKCTYCSFDDYTPNRFYSFGKDLIEDIVGLERHELTGIIKLATYNLDSVEINYCPMCGRLLTLDISDREIK